MDEVNVVVVDDSEDIIELLTLMIESRSQGRWRVVGSSRDGQRASEVVGQAQPDLVLLDVAMPIMDGLEALPFVRAAAPQARVVMLTAFSRDLVEESALAGGAVGCLEKSDLINSLLPRLQDLVDLPLPGEPSRGLDDRSIPGTP